MKLLTISIAAYNVEKYLANTLDSILKAGSLDSIEVLIVNDGSSDGTSEIGLKYQNDYPNTIILVDKKNGGHGSTINTGMDLATGKYFKALDGDDWINSDSLDELMKRLGDVDADIILSDYCRCFENGVNEVVEFEGLEKGKYYSFEEAARIAKWMRYHTVIFKTELLKQHNIRLDENCFYVDVEMMLYPIPFVEKVYYAKDPLYCYRLGISEQSVSPQSRIKNIRNGYTVSNSLISYYIEHVDDVSKSQKEYYVEGAACHCLWHYQSLMLFPPSEKKRREIAAFDNDIRNRSQEIFDRMIMQGDSSRSLRLMRKTRYMIYWPLQLYKRIKRG